MSRSFVNTARKFGIEAAKQAKKSSDLGPHFEENKKRQKINTAGTTKNPEQSSLFLNPHKSQENEQVMDRLLTRVRGLIVTLDNKIINKGLTLGFLPKLLGNATIGTMASITATGLKLKATMDGIKGELATIRLMHKDLIMNGWSLERFTENVAKMGKAFITRGESFTYNEAPLIVNAGATIYSESHMNTTVADMKVDMCREEIHRIANMYGIEADILIAMIKTAVILKSAGDIDISSNGNIILSSVQDLTLKANGKIKLEGLGGIEAASPVGIKMHAGGSLDMGATGAVGIQAGASLMMNGVATAIMSSGGVAAVTGSVGCMPFGMAPVPPINPGMLIPPVALPVVPNVPVDLLATDNEVHPAGMMSGSAGMTTPPGDPV